MSKTEWVIEDALFGKIKNVPLGGDVLKNFIKKVIDKHPNSSILLRNLSDIIVLVAFPGSETFIRDGEKYWKDILNEKQYADFQENGQLIIGWILVNEKYSKKKIQYIDFMDTLVPKYNLAKFMIDKYCYKNNVRLLPRRKIQSSADVSELKTENKNNVRLLPIRKIQSSADVSELKTENKKRKRNN